MPVANISTQFLAKLQPAQRDATTNKVQTELYYDKALRGFGVRRGLTKIVYFAERQFRGRTRRIKLGTWPERTPAQMRTAAKEVLHALSKGATPPANLAPPRTVALQGALDQLLVDRAGRMRPRTKAHYEYNFENYLSDWLRLELWQITSSLVAERYRRLAADTPAQAHMVFRNLRAVWNHAKALDDTLPENPVRVLSRAKLWRPVPRRTRTLTREQIPTWVKAARADANEDLGAYCLLLFYTGLRRMEAMTLRWADVDMKARTLTLADTKSRRPLTLPMPRQVYDLLATQQQRYPKSEVVFPARWAGEDGRHVVEIKRVFDRIADRTGIRISPHDLRRLYITMCESLDMPAYVLKALVNHALPDTDDVTAGYIQMTPERLRPWAQRAADALERAAAVPKSARRVKP